MLQSSENMSFFYFIANVFFISNSSVGRLYCKLISGFKCYILFYILSRSNILNSIEHDLK